MITSKQESLVSLAFENELSDEPYTLWRRIYVGYRSGLGTIRWKIPAEIPAEFRTENLAGGAPAPPKPVRKFVRKLIAGTYPTLIVPNLYSLPNPGGVVLEEIQKKFGGNSKFVRKSEIHRPSFDPNI